MRDIPPDVLSTVYAAVDDSGLRLTRVRREVVVLMAAQLVAEERARCRHHVATAKTEIRKAGDGSVSNVRRAAIGIVDAAEEAIISGASA